MNAFIDFNDIIFDNGLIMAIIAINMTIIGLTSLAETKSIIGIDYGKFLIKRYKAFNVIRIYHLLIVFAIINISSLFLMFVQIAGFRRFNFIILVFSLIFAIFYFFAYIIVENKWVKKQIYEQELLGLYYESDQKTTFEIDLLVEMANGSRTHKKLSGNIITYFNNFNSDTQKSFEEIFGTSSIIYDYTENMSKKRDKLYSCNPYKYRKSQEGIYDISHEFFQIFRYCELQDKWAIDILRLLNGEPKVPRKYDVIKLYNFARVITHINVFGYCESVYKYKFLEYLIEYYYSAVSVTKDESKDIENFDRVKEIEVFTLKQLFDYMFSTIKENNDSRFTKVSVNIINDIMVGEKYLGLLEIEEMMFIYLNKVLEYNISIMKEVFADILSKYYNKIDINTIPEVLKEKEVKKYIINYKAEKDKKEKVYSKKLFNC